MTNNSQNTILELSERLSKEISKPELIADLNLTLDLAEKFHNKIRKYEFVTSLLNFFGSIFILCFILSLYFNIYVLLIFLICSILSFSTRIIFTYTYSDDIKYGKKRISDILRIAYEIAPSLEKNYKQKIIESRLWLLRLY